jgi:hypothetical protein
MTSLQLSWSQTTPAPLRGLALAREPGTALAWGARQGLFRFDGAGRLLGQASLPAPVVAAGSADDGSICAAVGSAGSLWLLGPDLALRWERSVPRRPLAVALDALGERVAVADAGGGLHVYDRLGRRLWHAEAPRPLQFLAFVPEEPVLVASADYGLVACFDEQGQCLWRDSLVAHVGSLATTGDGGTIALACFTEGLVGYSLAAPRQRRALPAGPCRLAALSYSGDAVLTAGLQDELLLRDREGTVQGERAADGTPVGLALGPLGDYALVALAEGKLQKMTR